MSIFDYNDIPIDKLLLADDWTLGAKTHTFKSGFYSQFTDLNYLKKDIARLAGWHEHNNNYFISFEFWPKGYRFVKNEHLYTLRKHLIYVYIRSDSLIEDNQNYHIFYTRLKSDNDVFEFIKDIECNYHNINNISNKYNIHKLY